MDFKFRVQSKLHVKLQMICHIVWTSEEETDLNIQLFVKKEYIFCTYLQLHIYDYTSAIQDALTCGREELGVIQLILCFMYSCSAN